MDCLQSHLHEEVEDSQNRQKKGHDSRAKSREFRVDKLVYAKNYGSGLPWLLGKVIEKLGTVMYRVLLENGQKVRKHGSIEWSNHQLKETLEEVAVDLPFSTEVSITPDHSETTDPVKLSSNHLHLRDDSHFVPRNSLIGMAIVTIELKGRYITLL